MLGAVYCIYQRSTREALREDGGLWTYGGEGPNLTDLDCGTAGKGLLTSGRL